jgi:hypothetical protein
MDEFEKCFVLSHQNTTVLGLVLTTFLKKKYEVINYSKEEKNEKFISELDNYGKAIFTALVKTKKKFDEKKSNSCDLKNKYNFLKYFLKDYLRSNYDSKFNFAVLNIRNGYRIFGS